MLERKHRILGYYLVDGIKFTAKVEALIYAKLTNKMPSWHFNDDIFGAIDWSQKIETPLSELYRRRAQQLRDKYDYVSLFFSGGVDSGNALHAFVDNNIHLDEIVMYLPEQIRGKASDQDLTEHNCYSEILYAAIPHLQEIRNLIPNTKIRILDFCEPTKLLLSDDRIISQYYSSTPNLFSRSVGRLALQLFDRDWLNLYESGKSVCHIQGADKPLINIQNGGYSFQFMDSMVYNYQTRFSTEKSEMIDRQASHELFYWTPDLPELVIKQCQVVKEKSESNFFLKLSIANSLYKAVDEIIYPPHVLRIAKRFAVKKGGWIDLSDPWNWIESTLDNTQLHNYKYLMTEVQQSISKDSFIPGQYHANDLTSRTTLKGSIIFFKGIKHFL